MPHMSSAAGSFTRPDDPFPADLFAGDDFDYFPDDDPFEPFTPPEPEPSAPPAAAAPTFDSDDGWGWHDAAIVAVGRTVGDGEQFSIGAMDVYANVHTGDLGGSYLEMATFDDIDQAAAYYHELQTDIHDQGVASFALAEYASDRAAERAQARGEPVPQWRGASEAEYAAYDETRAFDVPDLPPDDLDLDDLFSGDAPDLDDLFGEPAAVPHDPATFRALSDIGIDGGAFDPAKDPPPFVDEATGTAYWIGVFQPDKDDPDNCVTSILSLGRDPDTGEMQAQLAPCVPGDWDKAYTAAEYLIDLAQRGGIESCFDAAEGMALATDQRDLWEQPHGVALEEDAAQQIADYTRAEWEIDL